MNRFRCSKQSAVLIANIGIMVALTLGSKMAFSQSPSNQLRGGEIQSMDDHRYGKVEVRMYTQNVVGTTSTFFWWRNGGHECGSQWNEIDIETIPRANRYQSNPIWQTSNNDCAQARREEGLHGNAGIYDRWVTYTLEWTPTSISWYHDGQLDRRISSNPGSSDFHESVEHIDLFMRYCFNLWTQGNANPAWLGNIDFNALRDKPVYQFVDYFRYYEWNGNGFYSTPTTDINFSSSNDLYNNFHISNWEFGESQGFLSWSPDAVGVVDIDGNGALWLGLFHAGDERAPNSSELPSGSNGVAASPPSGYTRLKAEHSGRCLNISGHSNANGGNIIQWSCGNFNNSDFQFVSRGSGWYNIKGRNGKCLDVSGVSNNNGANIQQWSCGNGGNQQFKLVDQGGGQFLLEARHSGKCINIANNAQHNGGNAIQWNCGNYSNSTFSFD